MDRKQGNKQEQNPPGEGRPIQSYEDEHDTTNSSGGMRRMLQEQQEGGQEEMPSNQRNLSLRSSSSNLLLDDILLDDADQQQQQDALGERGVVEERCRHKQKNKKYNKIVEEESFENETRKSQGTISSISSDERKQVQALKGAENRRDSDDNNDLLEVQETILLERSQFSAIRSSTSLVNAQIGPVDGKPKASTEDESSQMKEGEHEVGNFFEAMRRQEDSKQQSLPVPPRTDNSEEEQRNNDDKDERIQVTKRQHLSDENPGDRTAETEQQQEETSSDKTEEQNTESASKKETKAKVRNLARNRRRKAKEWNEKKQEEIARLTKLNVQLKEKNQALINELIMLGVDTNTIQLFLNCLHITNQELATAVPSPKYKFSL